MKASLVVYKNDFTGEDPIYENAVKQLKYHGDISSGKCLAEVFHQRCFEVHGIRDLVIGNDQGEISDDTLAHAVSNVNDVLENGGLIVTLSVT